MSDEKALRYNSEKVRYDLLEPFAIQQVAQVFTKGAVKYAPFNWLKGMEWSKMIASLKRHIAAFENGEDFDKETGELHMAHAAWNALGIVSYYKYYPQGDDRLHTFINKPKIGLDIDEVIADWIGHWTKYHGQDLPEFWSFDKDIVEKFELLKDDKDFWMSIPALVNPSELGFEPTCYITSRLIPTEWTREWLQANKFPAVPVYTVSHNASKIEAAKQAKIDWFIDDRYENYQELNKAGICTFLMNAKHNQRYDVGYRRILNFNDFKTRFL